MTNTSSIPGSPSGIERRKHARLQTVQFVWYHVLDFTDTTNKPLSDQEAYQNAGLAKLSNISPGGIELTITMACPKGTHMFIEVSTRDLKICFIGRVQRSQQRDAILTTLGIEIVSIPPFDLLLLKSFCKQ